MNQIIDPEDYLGLQYQKFQSTIRQKALSDPKGYFAIQQAVISSLKTQLVKDMYKTIYNFLRNGQSLGGDDISESAIPPAEKLGIVGMPTQLINQEALNITSTLNDFIDDLVEKILPTNYTKLAEAKTAIQAQK